jgi:translation initiation factor 2B subunit (eIF-2B alpha/beta/delta family)
MRNDLQQTWRAIAADNVSGASEIYSRVLNALLQHVSSLPPTKEALQDWPQLLRAMVEAQPTMAPLYNLANQLALIFEQEDLSAKEQIAQALLFLPKEERQAAQSNAEIAQHAFALIVEKPRVLTHSYSGTVAAALEYAQRNGVPVEVYLSEARPANEGRRMAERLARAGVPVHLFVDDARAHFMSRVDLVLLGADRIAEKFFVNKIGTRNAALLASAEKIPVAVLAGRNKLWPAFLPFGSQAEQASAEIWSEAPPHVRLHNFYFEETEILPEQIIITEDGILNREEIEREWHRFQAAKFWRDEKPWPRPS